MDVELKKLQQQWDACKAQDDEKHSLITALLSHINAQASQLSELTSDLDDKKLVARVTRERTQQLEAQIQELQLEKDRHAFVFVVIDGDCMLFRDDLVQAGLEGGKQAISLLKQSVEQKVKALASTPPPHLQVIVRVYANLKGLSQAYQTAGILRSSDTLEAFVRGFNMGDPLCDYVDAGNGKECADEKVKALFRHYLDDVHCRQVFFGASADNGYARLLGPYAQDGLYNRRICLIEGPPFERELAELKPKFETVSFDIFRMTQQLPSTNRKVQAVSPSNYANVARTASSPSPQSATSPSSGERARTRILRNRFGQRLDSPLNYSGNDFNQLKSRRLCNSFCIQGRCPFKENSGHCLRTHDDSLNEAQKKALRAVARLSPCAAGLGCNDEDCVKGHRCTKVNCQRDSCRFPQQLHNVSTQVLA